MIIIHVFETQHNDFVNFSNPGQTLRFYSAFSYEILFPPSGDGDYTAAKRKGSLREGAVNVS